MNPKGAIKWDVLIDGEVRSSPTIAPDGTIYVATQGKSSDLAGTVYAILDQNGGLMKGGWPKSYATVANDSRAQSVR